jgi:hypothetical protein
MSGHSRLQLAPEYLRLPPGDTVVSKEMLL